MGRHKVALPKNHIMGLDDSEQAINLWHIPRTASSEIVKIDNVIKDIQILSSRRRLTKKSLTDALTQMECAIYAIKQDLKKKEE